MLTYEDIRNDPAIRTYIQRADESLGALGYTEHSFAHVTVVAENAAYILTTLGYPERTVELAKIAGFLHDIGNLVNRVDHSQSGAVMAFRILDNLDCPPEEIAVIVTAIGNHDEGTAFPVNAVAAAIIDMVIGMSYGLISGYFGGRVDMVMQRILEVANGIPRLVIVTLLLLVLQPGMLTIIFALMLTEWVGMSRIARAEMLKLKEQEFVLASRTLGAGSFFIIFREVLPNIIGPIITQVMFSIPTAIFTEAFLSFVGLGIPVPQCSLGSLISEGFNSFTTHPYQIVPPIVVMALLMLSFNLVADGLREALDPKMKEM